MAELDIPAIHVTHDRDEALSLADDLAILVGGQLRQAGPATHVAAEPANPDTARLLGWRARLSPRSIVPVLDALLADGKPARGQDRLPPGSQNRTRNGKPGTAEADSGG
jgi:ABC-type proline/glycine betaine transport system ATPase subunit